MAIPDLFQSDVVQRDLTKFGPTHWNNVTELLEGLLGGADADGTVLTRDSASDTGASWEALPEFPEDARLNGSLHTSTTQAGTPATTAETDLWLYVLAANALSADGLGVRVTCFGTYTNNANTKTLRLKFGVTTIHALGGGGNAYWRITADIFRTGAASQVTGAHALASGITAGAAQVATPAENTAVAIPIKLTGQNGTASLNDIVFRGAVVETIGRSGAITISAWGDSLTGGTYPTSLAEVSNRSVINRGIGGETSTQIKNRFLADTLRTNTVAVIWAGRNNADAPETVKADIAAMIAALPEPRYLVISILNSSAEPSGVTAYNRIVSLNADLATLYGQQYVEVRNHLIGLYDPLIPQDVTDHANDIPPSSLRVDTLHLNTAGYEAVAALVQARLEELGL